MKQIDDEHAHAAGAVALADADKALYQAKHAERNRAVIIRANPCRIRFNRTIVKFVTRYKRPLQTSALVRAVFAPA